MQLREQVSSLTTSLSQATTDNATLSPLTAQYATLQKEYEVLYDKYNEVQRKNSNLADEQAVSASIARRVIVEVATALHQAKIPASTYTDSIATPAFLAVPTLPFNFPSDVEPTIKWIKVRLHEFQRIRRAFQYTIAEVEEKWKGQINKINKLLEQVNTTRSSCMCTQSSHLKSVLMLSSGRVVSYVCFSCMCVCMLCVCVAW